MRLRSVVAMSIIAASLCTRLLAEDKTQIMARAAHLFGAPLSPENAVFRFNNAYLLWLIFDTHGELFEITLQPIADDHSGVLVRKAPPEPARMTETDYRDALHLISKIKGIGALLESHGSNTSRGYIGSFNTDRYEQAYVDRVLTDDADAVRRLDVHFLREVAGAWEQVSSVDGQQTACLGHEWYYLSLAEAKKVEIGTWQTLQVAGPSLYSGHCFRTKVLHDEDGFIVEEPANETIQLPDIHCREFVGKVHLANTNESVGAVNVELLRVGGKEVIRTKTDSDGQFGIRKLPQGKYKFKVTKNGFKSLSGFVFLQHNAAKERVSFAFYLGT